ncbi:MAG: hypothetical protein ACOX8S_02205 [Christensenellales bacterium]|jgi:hypothetical protein
MEHRKFTITSPKNKLITLDVIPGHFTTSNSHITHYLDMSRLKFNALAARDIAREMATAYLTNSLVDTIICMEETEVVGAYLAEELIENGVMIVNADRDISVVTPLNNVNGQLIFQQSTERTVYNRHVILLVASASTGMTVHRALDCLKYYNGLLVGISSIFSAVSQIAGQKINSVFSSEDIPGYRLYKPAECDMCKMGNRLDAIVNYDGYTRF